MRWLGSAFATLEDAPWLEDPADGRYVGDAPLRWELIVPLLEASTAALRTGAWSTRGDGSSWLPGVEVEPLTLEEQRTLATFFDDPIEVDLWDEAITDGRHRTWGAWTASPGLVVPFRSRLLSDAALIDNPDYVRPAERDEYAASLRAQAGDGLAVLTSAVRDRAPLYVAALKALASR